MIWRLRTCFDSHAAVPALLVLAAIAANAATVSGSVRVTNAAAGGWRSKGDNSGVVVWIESSAGAVPVASPKALQVAQRKKHFEPPVLAVAVGTVVTFPNFDPIFHNVFSNYAGKIFDVGMHAPGAVPRIVMDRPGIVRVFCNIHPTMSAIIVVVDTPYMAVTGQNGTFRLDGVKPGEYRLHVFDEQATEQTLASMERDVTVGDDPVTLPPLEVSESGYIQMPHKNKYGKDYPAVIEDRPMYPPGRSARH